MTPSIKLEHSDARGEIFSIQLPDNRELMLIHSKAGAFRGGHSHSCEEIVVLLSGGMRYWKRSTDHDVIYEMLAPSSSMNMPDEIHLGEFIQDSWLIEWKVAEKGSWTQENFPPFRAMVEKSLQR